MIPGKNLLPLVLLAPVMALVSCESPIPRHDAFDHYYGEYMELIKPDLEALEQDLADGLIDQRTYDMQVAVLTDNVTEKVNNLIYYNHQLRDMERKRHGLPSGGSAGRGGGGGSALGHGRGGTGFSRGGNLGARGFGGGGFGGAGTMGMGSSGGLGGGNLPGFSGGYTNPARSIGKVY